MNWKKKSMKKIETFVSKFILYWLIYNYYVHCHTHWTILFDVKLVNLRHVLNKNKIQNVYIICTIISKQDEMMITNNTDTDNKFK